jgi:hypothetical protein
MTSQAKIDLGIIKGALGNAMMEAQYACREARKTNQADLAERLKEVAQHLMDEIEYVDRLLAKES